MFVLHKVERLINIDSIVMGINAVRPKGFYFSGETHDFWEVLMVKRGKVTAVADNRIHTLDEGKLLFHKPMEFHRIQAEGDIAPHLYIISFSASGKEMKQFENACYDLNIVESNKFGKITESFVAATNSTTKDVFDYYSSIAVSELEVFLLSLLKKEKYTGKALSYNEKQYAKIIDVMEQNYEKMLSIYDIANLCNMGVSNMKRIFSRYCDIGVAKYFLSLKMRKAIEMFDMGMKPKEVAAALGFCEINYFYTVFKRETGHTPSEYKKSR